MNPTPKTTADWIELLSLDRIERGWDNPETWHKEYWNILRQLPQEKPLEEDSLILLVKSTTANSRQRLRTCIAVKAIAELAGISFEAKRYRGRYNSRKPKPRDLPKDELIAQVYHSIKNPYWRWVYGVVATYGLRPHEALLLDFDAMRSGDNVAFVTDGKTGPRHTWPFHPEWFDEFRLDHVLLPPNVDLNRSHIKLGAAVCRHFTRIAKIPFHPYDLRHAFSVRLVAYGLSPTLAAKQMGHSLQVHNQVYEQWIARNIHDEAVARVLANPGRPQPPKNIS